MEAQDGGRWKNVTGWNVRTILAGPSRRLVLAGLSGLLLALSFPPYDLVVLLPVALVPLGAVYGVVGTREGARLGFAFGAVFYGLHTYWFTSFHLLALPGVVLIAGMVFALHGTISAQFRGNPWVFTASWIVLQYLVGLGPLAFPWSRVATALAADPLLVQPVRYLGELGWGGLFVLAGALLGNALIGRRAQGWWAAAVAVVVGLCLLEGGWRLHTVSPEPTDDAVLLLQPDVASTWHPRPNRPDVTARLVRMTRRHARPDDLVLWPETVVSGSPFRVVQGQLEFRTPKDRRFFTDRVGGSYQVILGVGLYDPEPGRLNQLNAAVLLGAGGRPEGFYAKRIPVPFGEYVPGMGRWRPVRRLARAAGTIGIRPSRLGGLLPVKVRGGTREAAIFICYEDAFPEYVRRQARRGADFLVNLSNDSWSRSRASHRQHFYRARLRAIETGRTLLRNGNTGISAILDPLGRVQGFLPAYRQGVLRGTLYESLPVTAYLWWGDGLTAAVAGILFLGGWIHERSRTDV